MLLFLYGIFTHRRRYVITLDTTKLDFYVLLFLYASLGLTMRCLFMLCYYNRWYHLYVLFVFSLFLFLSLVLTKRKRERERTHTRCSFSISHRTILGSFSLLVYDKMVLFFFFKHHLPFDLWGSWSCQTVIGHVAPNQFVISPGLEFRL